MWNTILAYYSRENTPLTCYSELVHTQYSQCAIRSRHYLWDCAHQKWHQWIPLDHDQPGASPYCRFAWYRWYVRSRSMKKHAWSFTNKLQSPPYPVVEMWSCVREPFALPAASIQVLMILSIARWTVVFTVAPICWIFYRMEQRKTARSITLPALGVARCTIVVLVVTVTRTGLRKSVLHHPGNKCYIQYSTSYIFNAILSKHSTMAMLKQYLCFSQLLPKCPSPHFCIYGIFWVYYVLYDIKSH